VYGAMGRAREVWGSVWGDGKGAGEMGWCMGRWEGCGRDGDGGYSQKKTSVSSPNRLYLMSECALSKKDENSIPFISKRLKTL